MNPILVTLSVLGTLAVATVGGYWAVVGVMRLASAGARRRNEGDGPESQSARDSLRGGRWIGYLERLAIAGSILVGYPAAIAIVVAIKGLGRYPELKDNPAASERFVIGTLASVIFAALCGVGGSALLHI